jgi:hypothetical protein
MPVRTRMRKTQCTRMCNKQTTRVHTKRGAYCCQRRCLPRLRTHRINQITRTTQVHTPAAASPASGVVGGVLFWRTSGAGADDVIAVRDEVSMSPRTRTTRARHAHRIGVEGSGLRVCSSAPLWQREHGQVGHCSMCAHAHTRHTHTPLRTRRLRASSRRRADSKRRAACGR